MEKLLNFMIVIQNGRLQTNRISTNLYLVLYYLDGYNETTTRFYRTQTNKNVDLGDAVVF